MDKLRYASLILATSVATVASAADFDGSVPLSCEALQAHDCLPTAKTCAPLKPETSIAPVFGIDFAQKQVRSPFRNALLPIGLTTTNTDSLVMQGAHLLFAWTALVDRKTGALTVSVSDSKGAYVAFGRCKAADKKVMDKK